MLNTKLIKFASGILLMVASTLTFAGQDLTGSWKGSIELSENSAIKLVFNFKKEEGQYVASIDVPQQNQFGLPFSSVIVDGDKLELTLEAAKMMYKGTIKQGGIEGQYSQGNFVAPLSLTPAKTVAKRAIKPQEPKGDLPYTVESVLIENKASGVTLSGTLTLPNQNPLAVAILISGSGPTNRDADIAGHKYFLVLADKLTRQGIAVLRYDDRGVGKSTGNFELATSEDFAEDAHAALTFVKTHATLKHSKVGYVGHSEGGLIGAIAGAKYKDADFFVSMAGVGTSGAQILIDQSYHIQKLMGMNDVALEIDDNNQREIMKAIEADIDANSLEALLVEQGADRRAAKAKTALFLSPWFSYFVKAQPKEYLQQLTMPVFAINGELDSQVLAPQNIEGFKKSVNDEQLTTKVYAQLNHLFQPAKTGLPNEYGEIDITIEESVVLDISSWIKASI
ncbi:alpha/beta hydrolase [Thalassotalea agarivorans]|uniref:Serine aminopeptidase S33 domain-containing protein n=1 Tax=Thalassotalea agarivorans TaxID=349064 RepID=A0A1H9ZUF4_THASX|nr:alpha/beta fold hydrolase [Thalassotalea agarivorans]SES85388.1 hypothetical protein SAMN05660429_00593 [Thalassotalea agarivorans]